jgi:hypothetical protein
MNSISNIPKPFQFNPLKHHLTFIREFIADKLTDENKIDVQSLTREISHIGSSVMDLYTGSLAVQDICRELMDYLKINDLDTIKNFSEWTGGAYGDFRKVSLSDTSQWILKYHNDEKRFVHFFPVRLSPHSFRVKANTLKSGILYYIMIGKDFINREDLNSTRGLLGLSPVKKTAEAEAITEMIEILRNQWQPLGQGSVSSLMK